MKIGIITKILRRKAYVIHAKDEHYALIAYENEFGEEDYYPLPMLPRIVRGIAKAILPQDGIRGLDFWFTCPYCGYKSFNGLRGENCPECHVYITKSDEWTWESIRAADSSKLYEEVFGRVFLEPPEGILKKLKITGHTTASPGDGDRLVR